jgi:pseudouridine-5'-phosphate glycosidase
MTLSDYLDISPDVAQALDRGRAVVALESTVIAHGLPRPMNLEIAQRCEVVIREAGAVPATVGVIHGRIVVGLTDDQLIMLAMGEGVRKVSRRDFPVVIVQREYGATTVSGTMIAAHLAGIRVFATGGIGGVHRGDADDVSADLPEIAGTPVAVVCAGAKSILDLPRTLEYLETAGVPVIGYQTDAFPAFYATSSGLPVDARAESPQEIADILRVKWDLGLEGGVVIAVPPPAALALDSQEMETAVQAALIEADQQGIRGKALTPFLLGRVSALTLGRSLAVNAALLEQNAHVAALIAIALRQMMGD